MGTVIHPLDTSDNKVVRTVQRLVSHRSYRERTGQTVLEGPRLVREALSAGARLSVVLYSSRLVSHAEGKKLVARLSVSADRTVYVTDRVLDGVSQVETHQGIVAVAQLTQAAPGALTAPRGAPALFVVAAGIQDPGNLGTLLRAAQAAGAHGMGVTRGTVEPLNPKAVRASAGSVFRLPVVRLDDAWAGRLTADGVIVRAAVVSGGHAYDEMDWTGPVAVVLGNEGNGLPDRLAERVERVAIPMVPTADSLNVAMAGSVLLFHAALERRRRGVPVVPPVMV